MLRLLSMVLLLGMFLLLQPKAFADVHSGTGDSLPATTTTVASSTHGSRANLELIILGILVGLIFRTTLDAIFKTDLEALTKPDAATVSWRDIIQLFRKHHMWMFPVFLLTLLRFVYGSYRFHETLPKELPILVFLIDAAGLMGDFVFFYLAGQSITKTALFLRLFVLVHLWDFLWFFLLNLALYFYKVPGFDQALSEVSYVFLAIDLATAILLLILMQFLKRWPNGLEFLSILLLLGIGYYDFYRNYPFYFSVDWPPAKASPGNQTSDALPKPNGKLTIYLAGPLFTQAEWQWNAKIAAGIRQAGYEVIVPQELARPMLMKEQPYDARIMFATAIAGIDRANVVVAVVDGPDADSGTCWECGYAYKSGRPIIAVRTDFRAGGEDKSGLNLMLTQSVHEVIVLPVGRRDDFPWLIEKITKANQLVKK
jgi:nucleoside 2-deoxyribosyltransferase